MNLVKFAGKAALCLLSLGSISGCLLTSPYSDQAFPNTTSEVPMQAWSSNPEVTIKFQCALSTRFGPYWISNNPLWHDVASVPANPFGFSDSKGNLVYSAGTAAVLPTSCWYYNSTNGIYYSAVRAYAENSPSSPFYTFREEGLECLSEKIQLPTIAATGDWFAWMPSHCIHKDGDDKKVHYVVVRTE